jgi:hypothetical protein
VRLTDADRARVRAVLADLLSEMEDSWSLEAMFAPYADIVRLVLTDRRMDGAAID